MPNQSVFLPVNGVETENLMGIGTNLVSGSYANTKNKNSNQRQTSDNGDYLECILAMPLYILSCQIFLECFNSCSD